MLITDIQAIPISVPVEGLKSALGTFPTFQYGIVLVHTDEGVIGLGEISTLWDGAGPLQCDFVKECFRPLLLGQNPTAINQCLHLMDTLVEGARPARAAVEMALFDILGKALTTPVYSLLGGRSRESIMLSRSVTMASPEEMAAAAADYVSQGFSCVKVKIGLDRDTDTRAVAAVREAIGPDTLLRVDANMGWRMPKGAIQAIKQLEPYDLHSVEQPLPRTDIDSLRLVRESVDTPIMVDESVWGPTDAWHVLRTGAADMLNVYIAESGGLTNASLIFRMAETVGVPCVIGAMPELGIGTAAAVHLGVSMTNLVDPCDACGVIYHTTDVVMEPFQIRDGQIWPPDRPGLGVTLDMDALEYFRVDR
jgi:L-alanine-DL-glutamate epimerase-like enolase superfamily enzyme